MSSVSEVEGGLAERSSRTRCATAGIKYHIRYKSVDGDDGADGDGGDSCLGKDMVIRALTV